MGTGDSLSLFVGLVAPLVVAATVYLLWAARCVLRAHVTPIANSNRARPSTTGTSRRRDRASAGVVGFHLLN